MSDIKELKESILAVAELGLFVSAAAKDGLDLQDLGSLVAKFVMDSEFKARLEAGVKGVELVPSELSDLDVQEALEIVGLLVELFKKFK